MKKRYYEHTISASEGRCNEDSCAVGKNFGIVVDGSSGLDKRKVTNYPTDAAWYSETLKNYLVEHINDKLNLKELMRNAIIAIDNEYNKFPGTENITSKPSAAIALYRIADDVLEYFVLGDCSIILRNSNNELLHLHQDDISNLDQININKMVVIANELGIDVADALPLIQEDLLRTRLTQNTEGGYWIVSNCPEAVDHALYGEVPAENIEQIAAMSDGFSQIFDTFGILEIDELMDRLETTPLQEFINILNIAKESDPKCNAFPRFKPADDKAIVFWTRRPELVKNDKIPSEQGE